MEMLMDLAAIAVNVAGVVYLSRHLAVPAPVVKVERTDEADAPKWGTKERRDWHVKQRDYHVEMVAAAGEAVNLLEQYGPKDS